MAANMFAALDGLDDEQFFAPLPAPAVVGQGPAGTGEKKAQSLERAPRASMTLLYPQTARPPIVPPEQVTESEVFYPPKAILTTSAAKKTAAMRLGGLFAASVIIYR